MTRWPGENDSPLGSRMVYNEMAKVTTSLEQEIADLKTTIEVYEHAFEMIGFDIRRAEKALNNLKGE